MLLYYLHETLKCVINIVQYNLCLWLLKQILVEVYFKNVSNYI